MARETTMNAIDFCFWLQGYFEIHGKADVSPEQAELIKNHLSLVFKHEIDPLRESQTETPVQALNHIHSGNDMLVRC